MSLHVFFCFRVGFFLFLLLTFESSLHVLDTGPLSDKWFANISFQSVVCLFIFLSESLAGHKFLILMKPTLSIVPFMDCAFGINSKNSLLSPRWYLFPYLFNGYRTCRHVILFIPDIDNLCLLLVTIILSRDLSVLLFFSKK